MYGKLAHAHTSPQTDRKMVNVRDSTRDLCQYNMHGQIPSNDSMNYGINIIMVFISFLSLSSSIMLFLFFFLCFSSLVARTFVLCSFLYLNLWRYFCTRLQVLIAKISSSFSGRISINILTKRTEHMNNNRWRSMFK